MLCSNSDIVFLQEHWLFPSDLPSLNDIHSDFMSFGTSSMNTNDGIVLGRPYGGVAVLWRKHLTPRVKPINFDDDRIVGLECHFDHVKMLLIGAYLPYNSEQNFEEFIFCLGKIRSIVDDFDSPYVYICGDFNADIEKQSSFGRELQAFCHESELIIADTVLLDKGSVTHVNEGHGTESWLDHVVCSKSASELIDNVIISYHLAGSDHFPMTAVLKLPASESMYVQIEQNDGDGKWAVNWSSLKQSQLDSYSSGVHDRLNDIRIPFEALFCRNESCVEHGEAINEYYAQIISCLNAASHLSISKFARNGHKVIPGWNENVKKAHSTLGDIYCLWAVIGKPRAGYIYDQLRIARSRFKYSLRWCIKNEKDLRAKSLADKLMNDPRDSASFWKEVKKINPSPQLSCTVGGVSGNENIACLWKEHFSSILNSVSDETLKDSVMSRLDGELSEAKHISVQEIKDALPELTSGRCAGHDGLYAEHLKFAGQSCVIHLSLCFSMMLKHGHLPSAFTKVVLVPILKDKAGSLSDKNNYRPIALASVTSKLYGGIILNRSRECLKCSDHQFGFKRGHATDMAIYAVKEISDYYLRNNSPVFLCYLDASKAFDRVNHWKLFDKLLNRNMDLHIVKLLVSWYRSQLFHCQWGNYVTDGFTVSNGVRQGGILSPFLFNLYIDSLSSELDNTGVGCRYLGSMNHLAYADDVVLMSPSPFGLQTLLDTCERFSVESDVIFNTKKTVCMVLRPKCLKNMTLPKFTLCGSVLSYISQYKYLGYQMSDDSLDNLEIRQQYRLLCCRANSLLRKFSMCSYPVKRYLFASYCANVYCVHLWRAYNVSVFRKFKVCLNNAVRLFFGYDRFCSASAMYTCEGIDNVDVMFRKAAYGFMKRIDASDNCIIAKIVGSDLCNYSPYRRLWNCKLSSFR